MRRATRWSIVIATFGACIFSGFIQIRERAIEKEPVPSELFDVIQAGILGLRAQHYQQVYRQASSRYQDRLDFEHFIETARADCVALRQANRWEFGVPKNDGQDIVVPVYFFLQSSEVLPALFTLVREDRAWKIEHVHLPVRTVQNKAIGGIRL